MSSSGVFGINIHLGIIQGEDKGEGVRLLQ